MRCLWLRKNACVILIRLPQSDFGLLKWPTCVLFVIDYYHCIHLKGQRTTATQYQTCNLTTQSRTKQTSHSPVSRVRLSCELHYITCREKELQQTAKLYEEASSRELQNLQQRLEERRKGEHTK